MDSMIYKKMCRCIERKIFNEDGRQKEVVLFPYGQRTTEFKEILNKKYGIKEKYIVDNGICKFNDQVLSADSLKEKITNNMVVFLVSDSPDNYNEIRKSIYSAVPFDQVVDVLSDSFFYDPKMRFNISMDCVRIGVLERVCREIYKYNIAGNIAEVGVYRGDFAREMARRLPDRKIYLFDTFEGFDERDIKQGDEYIIEFQKGCTFKDTSAELAVENVGGFRNIEVRKGFFPETAGGLENERFSLVSLDTDLYEPIKAGLEFFWNKMTPGGYIFVHDYPWGRVCNAVREFAEENHVGFVPICDDSTSVVMMKPY